MPLLGSGSGASVVIVCVVVVVDGVVAVVASNFLSFVFFFSNDFFVSLFTSLCVLIASIVQKKSRTENNNLLRGNFILSLVVKIVVNLKPEKNRFAHFFSRVITFSTWNLFAWKIQIFLFIYMSHCLNTPSVKTKSCNVWIIRLLQYDNV